MSLRNEFVKVNKIHSDIIRQYFYVVFLLKSVKQTLFSIFKREKISISKTALLKHP